MTAERLIYDACNFAAEIAPCGPEVIFGIGRAETAREIKEIEMEADDAKDVFGIKWGADDYIKHLLTIPGDNQDGAPQAQGPWQQWPIHFVDAWHYWERKGLKRIYQPNRATLNGQACEVACYLNQWQREEHVDGVTVSTYEEMWAAIHHYGGPGWLDKVHSLEQQQEWHTYYGHCTDGFARHAELKGDG